MSFPPSMSISMDSALLLSELAMPLIVLSGLASTAAGIWALIAGVSVSATLPLGLPWLPWQMTAQTALSTNLIGCNFRSSGSRSGARLVIQVVQPSWPCPPSLIGGVSSRRKIRLRSQSSSSPR